MTPEMITKLNEIRKKKKPTELIPTYKEYYNKRFLEECKYFIENPKFSMKYMMVMAHLQKNIKEKTLKEYKEKYPGAPINNIYEIDQKNKSVQTDKTIQKLNNRAPYSRSIIQIPKNENKTLPKLDKPNIIDYDIIDIPIKQLRRSERIKSKFN